MPGDPARPFRCEAASRADDIDHVIARSIVGEAPRLTAGTPGGNPFEWGRTALSSYALARSQGLTDEAFLALVRRLDRAVEAVDGRGFVVTPFGPQPDLGRRLGFERADGLWIKDETGNVSGSHKARHLMGIMLYLQVAEQAGLVSERPPLAIASCGNAALAAAVVSKAAGWPLQVFVPSSASGSVLTRLDRLGAAVTTCHREAGLAGDPCYLAFQRALSAGAIPFCCQGSDNGLTIEGGETLAWEMVERSGELDAVFIQVGGGALASAVIQGFAEARLAGAVDRLPRFFTVQTSGGFPLARAHERVIGRLRGGTAGVEDVMRFARTHRSQFMWPWEEEPRSIAQGILDDETYDWAAVVEGMLQTGGRTAVVGEDRLREANSLARSVTGIDVDHTGSAGLAGLMQAIEEEPDLLQSRVAVIFSGTSRGVRSCVATNCKT